MPVSSELTSKKMALRPSAAPLKGLIRGQKRGYAVQATVKKIVINPSHPQGSVPFLFSKQGKRLREMQKEISLRALADATAFTSTIPNNGGDAGLANLETAQLIVSSPKLLEQFKKDTELSKKALVGAVAWLKDIRNVKSAETAAAKIDASTTALLGREVAFSEIVPLRETLGLNLSLTKKATVEDWWIAYAAASKLRETQKTFSTLTGASLSAEAEKTLHAASLDRVRRHMTADARKFVQGKLDAMPAPLKVAIGSDFSARAFNAAAVAASVTAASRLIDQAASMPAAKNTISEIVSLLVRARNELREVADSVRAEAEARQLTASDAASVAAWASLSDPAAEAAVKSIQSLVNADSAVNAEAAIQAQLPSEYAAINEALEKFSKVASALPKELVEAELTSRTHLGAESGFHLEASA